MKNIFNRSSSHLVSNRQMEWGELVSPVIQSVVTGSTLTLLIQFQYLIDLIDPSLYRAKIQTSSQPLRKFDARCQKYNWIPVENAGHQQTLHFAHIDIQFFGNGRDVNACVGSNQFDKNLCSNITKQIWIKTQFRLSFIIPYSFYGILPSMCSRINKSSMMLRWFCRKIFSNSEMSLFW